MNFLYPILLISCPMFIMSKENRSLRGDSYVDVPEDEYYVNDKGVEIGSEEDFDESSDINYDDYDYDSIDLNNSLYYYGDNSLDYYDDDSPVSDGYDSLDYYEDDSLDYYKDDSPDSDRVDSLYYYRDFKK